MLLFWIAAAALLLCLLTAFVCFLIGFYSPPRKPLPEGQIDLPEGEIYEPFHPAMKRWAEEARALPQEPVQITTPDGLTLRGIYYEFSPDAPVEIMVHGYRGNSERDMSGGVQRCFRLGHSALIVDQRASGKSDGSVITFGIREHQDCLLWLDYVLRRFGPDVRVILTGISMGAATVMMTADKNLPENVMGILADCGYTSPKDIILEVIPKMKLPAKLMYPFVRLGAILFGHFDPEADSPGKALQNSTVPVIFFHGDGDDFVPCAMSRENFGVCASRKKLVIVPGAGHGLAYPTDIEGYLKEVKEFFAE